MGRVASEKDSAAQVVGSSGHHKSKSKKAQHKTEPRPKPIPSEQQKLLRAVQKGTVQAVEDALFASTPYSIHNLAAEPGFADYTVGQVTGSTLLHAFCGPL